MLTFLKQFTNVIGETHSQVAVSKVIASNMLTFVGDLPPFPRGCIFDVVFGGSKISSIAFRPSTMGWAGQLSTIKAIFLS